MSTPNGSKTDAAFANSDAALVAKAEVLQEEREKLGLSGLTGGLEAIVVNVEPEMLRDAAQEFLDYTGHAYACAHETDKGAMVELKLDGSADILVTCRKQGPNPFLPYNVGPKTEKLPNARLETYVYRANDLERYVAIQKERGVDFLTDEILRGEAFDFIQTAPSPYTGNSLGFVQWKVAEGTYKTSGCLELDLALTKPDRPHLANIKYLDHSATRVRAEERDAAILEFMHLTNYSFEFSVYVESFNSITNVTRVTGDDYAQVFTSGIKPFENLASSGPTEKYIHNYGVRTHHLAFHTQDIEATYEALREDGMEFLVELVGGPEEGLHQTFSETSPRTFLVNEYIHRYGDFDGFFTKSNVTLLTKATEKQ